MPGSLRFGAAGGSLAVEPSRSCWHLPGSSSFAAKEIIWATRGPSSKISTMRRISQWRPSKGQQPRAVSACRSDWSGCGIGRPRVARTRHIRSSASSTSRWFYGEGERNAFRRLEAEIQRLSHAESAAGSLQTRDQTTEDCPRDLRCTDPLLDKVRIEQAKGGLLRQSYRWVLQNSEFQQWRDDKQTHLLWIKGDPGKGKTMLLCGITDEIQQWQHPDSLVVFFFCQATDARINSARAVLRGLVHLLARWRPSLAIHLIERYRDAGKDLSEGPNAWPALTAIFAAMLADPDLPRTYVLIDALDECQQDLPNLLECIVQNCGSSRIPKKKSGTWHG